MTNPGSLSLWRQQCHHFVSADCFNRKVKTDGLRKVYYTDGFTLSTDHIKQHSEKCVFQQNYTTMHSKILFFHIKAHLPCLPQNIYINNHILNIKP
jgi:hypothetical protein